MIVDGDGAVFTLRKVDEYLRHPSSTETELEPAWKDKVATWDSDSDASHISWLIAPTVQGHASESTED